MVVERRPLGETGLGAAGAPPAALAKIMLPALHAPAPSPFAAFTNHAYDVLPVSGSPGVAEQRPVPDAHPAATAVYGCATATAAVFCTRRKYEAAPLTAFHV